MNFNYNKTMVTQEKINKVARKIKIFGHAMTEFFIDFFI